MPSELDLILDEASAAIVDSPMGEAVSIAHGVGLYYEIRAIWSDPSARGDEQIGVVGEIGARLADLTQTPVRGDKAKIGTTEYRIVGVAIDSTGWVRMGVDRA